MLRLIEYHPSIESDVIDVPIVRCPICRKLFYLTNKALYHYHQYVCQKGREFDYDEYFEFCRVNWYLMPPFIASLPHRDTVTEKDCQGSTVHNTESEQVLECPKCKWKISCNDPVGFLNHIDNCSE